MGIPTAILGGTLPLDLGPTNGRNRLKLPLAMAAESG